MKLKKINHIGIVVNDIDEAKERYGALVGIKKWYEIVNSSELDMTYKGEKRKCNVTLYVGGKGTTKLELIQTRGDENIYTEFLKRNGEGIHHAMYNVKSLDKAIEYYAAKGLKVLQQATFKSGGAVIKYAYVGKSETDFIFELIETTLFGFLKKGDMPLEIPLGLLGKSYRRVK